jgi:hypothetical protein
MNQVNILLGIAGLGMASTLNPELIPSSWASAFTT